MTTVRTLTDDEVDILLGAATRAPSMHNTQPWRFEIDGPVVDILLDPARALPAEDSADRLLRVGIGAAALNLRVAAARLGHDTTYAFVPDPARPEVAARIFLSRPRGQASRLGDLFGEIRRRTTYRGPMRGHEVAARILARLGDSVRTEGAELRLLDRPESVRLGAILCEADELDRHDDPRIRERLSWIGGERDTDGMPDAVLGSEPADGVFVRDLSADPERAAQARTAVEQHPQLAVLTTADEDEHAWLRAGMALQRMLLLATSYDLAASFLNQPLEYPGQRLRVRELVGGRRWPQMILRLGYPADPLTNHTPRRAWSETVDRRF